jgi:hypothetical protein
MSGLNQQPNTGNYPQQQFQPFYYYNQNPYGGMGMPQMNMGMNPNMNMGVNPTMENQNFGYDMKNTKNSGNEEPNPNFYSYNFYKQN